MSNDKHLSNFGKEKESIEVAKTFLLESNYKNISKSPTRKQLDLVVDGIKTEVKSTFIGFSKNEIDLLEKEKCLVVIVTQQGVFLCKDYKFFEHYKYVQSVSLDDDYWLFLREEFKTDSATDQIENLINEYKNLKGLLLP